MIKYLTIYFIFYRTSEEMEMETSEDYSTSKSINHLHNTLNMQRLYIILFKCLLSIM